MELQLKNHENKTVTLIANGRTYLQYKNITGKCLGDGLQEFFVLFEKASKLQSRTQQVQDKIKNYHNLSKDEQSLVDSETKTLLQDMKPLNSVVDKAIYLVASMIAVSDKRYIDDIVDDIDLNWFALDSQEFAKIVLLIKSLLPQKPTQKKSPSRMNKKKS